MFHSSIPVIIVVTTCIFCISEELPNKIDETKLEIPQYDEDSTTDKWDDEKDLIQKIIDRMDPDKMKEYHRFLTAEPHLAATERDDELAYYIRDNFEDAGFDEVELKPYKFMLSRPDVDNPNKITIKNGDETVFTSRHMEDPIHPDDTHPNFVHAFNAFTPAGTVTTKEGAGLVYVNYGRIEDFEMLEQLGINISGHIALIRFGNVFRGNKVIHAEKAGAVGVILFTDSEDVAPLGTSASDVYDNTWYLPGSGMQRGSTYLNGDPSTPGWPSTDNALRLKELPIHKIPEQPIGYDDAAELMKLMGGPEAPSDWHGGIEGVSYNLGPKFLPEYADYTVTLSSHNSEDLYRSFNVIGTIKGSIEPDRYVMLGNHRDAWGYGAVDPSSGTAQMLEVARVFGTLLKEGWRPRSSIVLHSWGAEEYGIMGSREFVEENINKLQDRTVAYVNTDSCAVGPIVSISASPLFQKAAWNITNLVPGVMDSTKTLLEEWREYARKTNETFIDEFPQVRILGGGSDHEHFAFYAGIPSISLYFGIDKTTSNVSSYPAYHTGFDTFFYFNEFVDPEYKSVQACGRLSSLMLKYLADSSIIPFDLTNLPNRLLDILKNSDHRDRLISIYDKYEKLENSMAELAQRTEEFKSKLEPGKLKTLELRAINDQMMKLEQMFILPEGLMGRLNTRNAALATSQFDSYSGGAFPYINDYLYDYGKLEGKEKEEREFKIKKHISDLTIMTDRATAYLLDAYKI